MVLVKRIHKRGANIVVEANGEVLFAATGDVGKWQRRFSDAVRTASAAEAPTNKRPRWGHYGKPLKSTFTASTTYQPGRMRVYSAVGSTAPHGFYVDQGTGVFAGNGPYEAKILPPWHRGSPSLYEHTWRPGGRGKRVKPVLIKGQKGQFFFDAGLKRGFEVMRMRSFDVPSDAKITEALSAIPHGLLNFLGNTEANPAFIASLTQWREWRRAAWDGQSGAFGNEGVAKFRSAARAATAARKAARAEKRAAVRASSKHGLPAKQEAALKKAIRKPPTKKEQFLATKAAAEKRRLADMERLRKQREAKDLGERKRAEKARKDQEALAKRLVAKNFEKARLDAYKYLHAIEAAYPDAVVQISKDKTMIRVHYTGPDGAVNEYFLR
jgi:hypothetical protein